MTEERRVVTRSDQVVTPAGVPVGGVAQSDVTYRTSPNTTLQRLIIFIFGVIQVLLLLRIVLLLIAARQGNDLVRIIYDVTYPVVRALHPVGRRKWPADPRHPLEHAMHVNEQTPASLRRLLKRLPFARVRVRLGSRTGGQGRQTRWQRRLARVPLVRRYVVRDIWAVAEKPI